MKRNSYVYAAGLVVLLAGAPFASASDDKAAPNGTTVTGCVTTAADGKSFTLTETSQDAQTPAKTWNLVATGGVDLSKYANHKVEITGTSEDKGGVSTDRSASEERVAAATSSARIHVKSVKDISNTCS
jgi:hypothetical protein